MNFADRLQQSIEKSQSYLCAGFDPVIDTLPTFLINEARMKATSDDELVERSLGIFRDIFISAVKGQVAAIKPNIAFFEQYGVAGVRAFAEMCKAVRESGIPLIVDAKRGDIGSTATAYSNAFLGRATIGGKRIAGFDADALTVNPFLGFDTLEPFLRDCQDFGKGIFILVQTSNPGAKDLEGLIANGLSVSQHVALWIQENAEKLNGTCGWSGLGAVVGASYPEDAMALRKRMPHSMFLIPGFGAQGASAQDSVAGFGTNQGKRGGGIVNVSRGLLEGASGSAEELIHNIRHNLDRLNQALTLACQAQ